MHAIDRRDFLRYGSAAAAALIAAPGSAADAPDKRRPKLAVFSESFQDLPIPEVCRIFAAMGLDGLDLTVRPGGHIDPKDAPEQLPKAQQAAREAGLEILFLTTNVTDKDDESERLLAACAEAGVSKIKLGYYRYAQFGTLKQRLEEIRGSIGRVARLGAKHGVLPCVHIHSGDTIPSHGTQLYELIREFSPDEVGAYVDPMHMTLEGGGDGWRQGLDLLAPWIRLSTIKNFVWEPAGRDERGQMRWRAKKVPIADGMAPLPEYVALLKQIGFSGVYSLHSEYKGGGSFRDLSTQECIEQTERDLAYLKTLL